MFVCLYVCRFVGVYIYCVFLVGLYVIRVCYIGEFFIVPWYLRGYVCFTIWWDVGQSHLPSVAVVSLR